MILIGLDDTDTADSRGTNQLAKLLVRTVLADYHCLRIVRHQLLFDERIPFTSKNGSASIWLDGSPDVARSLFPRLREAMLGEYIVGSDPGLCLAADVPEPIVEFGLRCQQEIVTMGEAQRLAAVTGVQLAGLGGTNGGIIGALAAVGLAATNNDGRIVHTSHSNDELSGVQRVDLLQDYGVAVVDPSGREVRTGQVDVGKKLRPNLRDGRSVLFVEPVGSAPCELWRALKLH